MLLTDNHKDKLIIVAEHDQQILKKIRSILKDLGLQNIKIAHDGSKIYEILRPLHNQTDQVGLIIVDEALPQCNIKEMCQALCKENEGLDIPVIILSAMPQGDKENPTYQLNDKHLIYALQQTSPAPELSLLIRLFLMLRHERLLRTKQEERLINELADRKIIDAKLKFFVAHDELTGLLNRAKFERHIKMILNRDSLLPQQGYLLFIDIDRFGLINELESYEIGDRLIIEVVDLIRQTIMTDYLFARIGSDEFCLFLEHVQEDLIKSTAENIRKEIDNFRFFSGTTCYNITVSIGISSLLSSKAVTHPGDLIARAHQACKLAKLNGRNTIKFYNEKDEIIKERHRDLYWVPVIRDALKDNRLFLVFQPVVNLYNGDISHYEVLLRMQGHSGETIHPGEFIPIAERMGLIHSIDLWVVEKAIDFLANLPPEQSHISLAINLSSVAFQDDNLLPAIKQKLEMTWVNANRITFEITETAAIDNFQKTREMVVKVRALGCHFALDDFGSGFCSFNYLKRFPVDFIKIDGQFIQNLLYDETDQVLVKSMCEIARKLGKKTIAEYIETPQLISFLKEMGIDYGQGYLLGGPKTHLLQERSIALDHLTAIEQQKKIQWNFSNNSF